MNRKISCSILIIIAVFVCDCSEGSRNKANQGESIYVNLQKKERDKLFVKINEIMPLETTDSSIFGEVAKIRHINSRTYILDVWNRKGVFAFDQNGNFINSTGIGKGPGEMVNPFSMTFRDNDSTVIVFDQGNREFYFFDRDLNYQKKIKFDGASINDFEYIGKDKFLLYTNYLVNKNSGGKRKYDMYALASSNFSEVSHLGIVQPDKTSQELLHPINILNKEALFIAPWDLKVYQIAGNQAKIKYKIDFGQFTLTETELKDLSSEEIYEKMNRGQKVGLIFSIYQTESLIGLTILFKREPLTYFISLDNGSLYCFNDCFKSNSIPKVFIRGVYNGSFYGEVEPNEMIRYQKETGLFSELNIKENDNPILISFNLSIKKEF